MDAHDDLDVPWWDYDFHWKKVSMDQVSVIRLSLAKHVFQLMGRMR